MDSSTVQSLPSAQDGDNSPPLSSEEDKQFVQQAMGGLLYHAKVCDASMLTAVASIATELTNATKNTMTKVKNFSPTQTPNPD